MIFEGIRQLFDSLFCTSDFNIYPSMTYTAVGLMGGYVYRNIPLRIECNIWTNFILDPNRPCFAHFALIILILHGFVGFTRYLFHPIEGKGHHIAYRKMKAFGDIIPIIAILYPMPLFLLSLYFNYDYGYGISGLHIAYPLLAILPYLLGEDLSRDMLDFVQVVTGLSAALLSFATGNYFIITAVVTQLFIYHFSHFRGEKYKRGSSTAVYNVAITLSIYLFYNAFTQSCIDGHGAIDCQRIREIMGKPDYCENRGFLRYS